MKELKKPKGLGKKYISERTPEQHVYLEKQHYSLNNRNKGEKSEKTVQ